MRFFCDLEDGLEDQGVHSFNGVDIDCDLFLIADKEVRVCLVSLDGLKLHINLLFFYDCLKLLMVDIIRSLSGLFEC